MGVRLVGDQPGALETLLSLPSPFQERRPVICEGHFLAILEVPIRSAEACAHESLLVAVLHNGLAESPGAPRVPLGVTRESTSGLLPSLLPWTNGQCPHAARRKLTDHAVLVSFLCGSRAPSSPIMPR